MKNIRKESVYKYLNDIWNSQKKTKIKTFDEYLDYIKDKHCIIWCVETCSSVNDIDDRLQREYWRHIKFFDTNKELQIFSKSIKHNYETVYNLKSILLHEYGNMYKINNLANNIFYGCFHDDYIDFVNVFRHIHFDKFDN
tara:strand:+ start:524 stop:943 length:420 start_codon:yes stop_codon:yes gene_type:complete